MASCPVNHTVPMPTDYPTDDFQCVLDCINGQCDHPLTDKVWSHQTCAGYAAYMDSQQPCPCPGPCPPCSKAEFEAIHAAIKSGKKMVGAINWQQIFTFIMSLLSQLFPPAPTPTPA